MRAERTGLLQSLLGKNVNHWTPRYIWDRSLAGFYRLLHPGSPWLTRHAVRILESRLAPRDRGLEFGAGGSTLWFGRRVGSLTSVEHDPLWYGRVGDRIRKSGMENVDLRLRTSTDYTRVLDELEDGSLDFVLVDGVFRDHCAAAALRKLKGGGTLIIDDIHWFVPNESRCPGSRREGYESPMWKTVFHQVENWSPEWTSDGLTDTLILTKPG
ncbi:MAG: class I SAM-dependent methyltransferase [Nitrospirae bacterium]|nr:class I SAM-dependent methyltransferase [Nitrospirota bacterium]